MTSKPDIVTVVSRYMHLVKVGSSYAGKCPFHATNTYDAFRVSPALQIYRCFNCGATGDVYNFVMRFERVGFSEAVRLLEIDRPVKRIKPKAKVKKAPVKIQKNQTLLEYAVSYWQECLKRSYMAKKYLESRGIIDSILVEDMHIGYAPKRGLFEFLKAKGFSTEEIQQEGLIREGDYGHYDFFRNRVIFPVYDKEGRIATITSRSIDAEAKVRHLHLPGTIDCFYNERAIDSTYIIVTEGIFDCLSLLQEGFNAIAVFGTGGLRHSMAKSLKKVGKIYLAYDKEVNQAGQKGIERALQVLKEAHVENVFIVELPYLDGKKMDINDLFSQHGLTKQDFTEILRSARIA